MDGDNRILLREILPRLQWDTPIRYMLFDAKGDFIHGWRVGNSGQLTDDALQAWDARIIAKVRELKHDAS